MASTRSNSSKDSKWIRFCARDFHFLSLSHTQSQHHLHLMLDEELAIFVPLLLGFIWHFPSSPPLNLASCYGKSNRNIMARENDTKRHKKTNIGRARERKTKTHLPQSYEQILPNDSSKITQNDPKLKLAAPFFILHSHGFYEKNVFFSAIFRSYVRSAIVLPHKRQAHKGDLFSTVAQEYH